MSAAEEAALAPSPSGGGAEALRGGGGSCSPCLSTRPPGFNGAPESSRLGSESPRPGDPSGREDAATSPDGGGGQSAAFVQEPRRLSTSRARSAVRRTPGTRT